MFTMHKHTITIAAIIFVLIVVGMFTYAYLKKNELEQPQVDQPAATSPEAPIENPYAHITRVTAKHFFIEDTHTLAGEIMLPTACDLLEPEVVVMESYPEQVHIDFQIINTTGDCPPQATPQRFKVSFVASESAQIRATVAGNPVTLNRIPAAAGETPDDFELFIKG